MQVSDMRALRILYSHKHNLLSLTSPKSSSSPSFISCKFRQNPKFSRQLHSSQHRKFPLESPDASTADSADGSSSWSTLSPSTSKYDAPVETFYDPISGRITTKRDFNDSGNNKEAKPNSTNQRDGDSNLSAFDHGEAAGTRLYGEIIGNSSTGKAKGRGKGKSKTTWVCSDCGYSDGQWWGYCRSCNATGSMKQFSLAADSSGSDGKVTGFQVSENLMKSWLPEQSVDAGPIRLTDVKKGLNSLDWRIPLSGLLGAEVGRVLGGGLVPGSLVLVGGDPGVGKSTLLLQIAAIIAEAEAHGSTARSVVYVSGEESIEQIGDRADRMRIGTRQLFLYSSTDIETVYLKGVTGSAGSIFQVKECTSALLRFAKKSNTPVLLAGHVTKSGDIAGPRVLEHIVDVVLYMEGERSSSHRLLRAVKNRFGSTDEVGVFEMSQSGLQAVSNPSQMFLSEEHSNSEFLAGLAVAVLMDGSRAFLLEIQALCIAGSSSSVSRQVNGVQASRADMIIAVLTKQAGLKLQENGIFLNVVSGVNLSETAGDLSIAAAICSSFLEFPIPRGVAFIGEIGLAGEIRTVPTMDKRVSTLAKLGYKKCIVSKFAEEYLSSLDLGDMQIVGCENLKDMINAVFRTS